MTKLTAIVLAALALIACSEDEPNSDTKGATIATASGVAPCPTAGAVGDTEPPAPKELPNLVDRCEGAYECDESFGSPGTKTAARWLRLEGGQCLYGAEGDVLYRDGRMENTTYVGEASVGEWSGDYTTFHLNRSRFSATCTRLPNQ